MTTANKITVVRICLIPFYVMMAIYYGRSVDQGTPHEWMRWAAIAIFVLAAATDGIDGYVARRFNQVSKLGAVLDPIADKGLLLSGIFTLSLGNWIYKLPLWFVILVVSRDLLIMLGAALVHQFGGGIKIQPSWTGKSATVLQMVALGMIMVLQQHNDVLAVIADYPVSILDLAVAIAAMFTLASGVGYIVDTVRNVPFRE